MVQLGEIEIDYPGGKNINAMSLKDTIDIPKDFVYSFYIFAVRRASIWPQ